MDGVFQENAGATHLHLRGPVRHHRGRDLRGWDVTAIAVLAGTSLVTDGTWGGFYLWKSKNENRAKYAQRFLNRFADKYGADIALRAAEIVLKD